MQTGDDVQLRGEAARRPLRTPERHLRIRQQDVPRTEAIHVAGEIAVVRLGHRERLSLRVVRIEVGRLPPRRVPTHEVTHLTVDRLLLHANGVGRTHGSHPSDVRHRHERHPEHDSDRRDRHHQAALASPDVESPRARRSARARWLPAGKRGRDSAPPRTAAESRRYRSSSPRRVQTRSTRRAARLAAVMGSPPPGARRCATTVTRDDDAHSVSITMSTLGTPDENPFDEPDRISPEDSPGRRRHGRAVPVAQQRVVPCTTELQCDDVLDEIVGRVAAERLAPHRVAVPQPWRHHDQRGDANAGTADDGASPTPRQNTVHECRRQQQRGGRSRQPREPEQHAGGDPCPSPFDAHERRHEGHTQREAERVGQHRQRQADRWAETARPSRQRRVPRGAS